ncbi:MAG: hypothetical protein ACHQ51_00465 [Elusimicrobiota bacterium]
MRTRAAIVGIAMGLSACVSTVTSKDAPLGLPPAAAPVAGVSSVNIDVSLTKDARGYSNYQGDFFATLLSTSEANGLLARQAEQPQPLRLFASLTYAPANDEPNMGIGLLSFFLPPFSFVPESRNENYSVRFVVRDRNNAIVYQNAFNDAVQGYMKGWYVARINAWHALSEKMAAAAARGAARLVLQDLAAHADALPTLTPAAAPAAAPREKEPAAGVAPESDDWWRKKP